MHIPRTSSHIIACFLKITRTDGTIDYSVMLEQDWTRLAGYSAKNNKYWDNNTRQWVEKANELYTSGDGGIDPAFLCSKCIKHAFGTYPKLNIGKGTQLETTVNDMHSSDFDPYGGIDSAPGDNQQSHAPNDSFAPPADTSNGVRIDPANTQQSQGGTANEAADDTF